MLIAAGTVQKQHGPEIRVPRRKEAVSVTRGLADAYNYARMLDGAVLIKELGADRPHFVPDRVAH